MKSATLRKYGAVKRPLTTRPFPDNLPPVPLASDSEQVQRTKWLARLRVQIARSLDRWNYAKEKYGPAHARTLAAASRNLRLARRYDQLHQLELPLTLPTKRD